MEYLKQSIYKALSSELLSPISVIQQNIEALKNHCTHSDKEFSEDTFSFTENSIENVLGFIENFHFLYTADQKSVNLNPQWFSIQELISQITEELRHLNLDTSRINVIALPHQLNVLSDRYLISRILINLLSNALKFSAKKIELNISIYKNRFTIQVHDYGIGIPDSQLKEVFNPFVRCENAIRFPGTGIGLSIVSRAVECLDGTVSVHSEPENGTEFQVVIPYHHIRKKNQNLNTLSINKNQPHYD